jgi:phenylacetic acid degradation operon negative regulatory protein
MPSVPSPVTTVERPLSARSVLASTLLGTEPPRLPVSRLLRAGELFGLAPGAVRTALSRMVAAGEAVRTADGWYELGGELVHRQRLQRASRDAAVVEWSGRWRQAVVVRGARSGPERAGLRRAMARLRMAELRDGVWLRPDNLDPDRWPDARTVADDQCRWFATFPDDDAALAATLWDLDGWAQRADSLRREMHGLAAGLADGDPASLARGFVVSAAVLRHFGADPLLPRELRPRRWPADALRGDYDRYDAAYRRALRRWFDAEPTP